MEKELIPTWIRHIKIAELIQITPVRLSQKLNKQQGQRITTADIGKIIAARKQLAKALIEETKKIEKNILQKVY